MGEKAVVGDVFLVVLALVLAGSYVLWRRSVAGAWREAAQELKGEYSPGERLRIGSITGNYAGYPVSVFTRVSYEDGPGFHHTAVEVTCPNPGALVLGVRRKSALEQVTSRSDSVETPTGDEDFDSSFFVVSNDGPNLSSLLNPDVRARMKRLDSVEVYVRSGAVAVRRPGEQKQSKEILEMAELAGLVAQIVSVLPQRSRSIVERSEDDGLIERGV